MDQPASEFKLTYYVGAMLAHGGTLSIKQDSLVFAPRPLERTLGAADTVILFEKVKSVEVSGTITESLIVKTADKAHRFVGSDPYRIRDRINDAIQLYSISFHPAAQAPAPAAPKEKIEFGAAAEPKDPSAGLLHKPVNQCPSCSQAVRTEYHFCPFCNATLRASCSRCFRFTETNWKFCAFCGNSLPAPAPAAPSAAPAAPPAQPAS